MNCQAADPQTLSYTDIHAHLADARILPQLDEILAESRRRGVKGILANAARREEWPEIVRMSTDNPDVDGALGLHPFFVDAWESSTIRELRSLLEASPGCVAVGEIGLDYYHGRENRAKQLEAFEAQVALAVELQLPVIVHNRKSWDDFFSALRNVNSPRLRGVCHHFSGSVELARQALDAGFFLSFCGPVTYPNARRLKAVAAYVPADRLLTETDTPDLPPAACRDGESRPWHVADVVSEVAALRSTNVAETAAAANRNFAYIVAQGNRRDGTMT